MGCGVTLTKVFVGAAPVTPPAVLVGNTTWDMKTFQAWPFCELGSTFLSWPYQTASARPGPPALIHGNTFTASPVVVDASLTCTGVVQLVHPLAALAALTKTCRWLGVLLLMHQTRTRLRALSIESTEKSVSGEPVGVSAILMSLLRSCPPATASRKCSVPVASGVPMLRYRPSEPHRPAEHPAAWKTLPVTWSIAGYPSAPKG